MEVKCMMWSECWLWKFGDIIDSGLCSLGRSNVQSPFWCWLVNSSRDNWIWAFKVFESECVKRVGNCQ
jgi:hypothetical protein